METVLILGGFGLIGFIAFQIYQAFEARRDLRAFEAQYHDADIPLFQRMRSAGMQEILSAADTISFDALKQAAIRLGRTEEVAEAYAEQILDELYPPSDNHAPVPNMGGLGSKIPFGGPVLNFNPKDLAAVPYFGIEANFNSTRRTVRDAEARGEDPYKSFAAAPLIGVGDAVEIKVHRRDWETAAKDLDKPRIYLEEWIPATVVNLTGNRLLVASSDGERMAVEHNSKHWRKVL